MPGVSQQKKEGLFLDPIDVKVPHISTDKAIKYDYDIVYVRTPRKGDKARSTWTEIAHPAIMDPQGDLMLMLGIPSDEVHEPDPDEDEVEYTEDELLLNGPQLPGNENDQSAIDALLADM